MLLRAVARAGRVVCCLGCGCAFVKRSATSRRGSAEAGNKPLCADGAVWGHGFCDFIASVRGRSAGHGVNDFVVGALLGQSLAL